jgi:AcrR family transcriptional regulator
MTPASARRQPIQGRARVTYAAILEAAARVLVEHGYDQASTNRVARVAGVSVGTLYQYFGNKEGVYTALIDQLCDGQLDLLRRMTAELARIPLAAGVHTYVGALVARHAAEGPLHRALSQQAAHLAVPSLRRVQAESICAVRAYLEAHRAAILPRDLDLAAYVLVAMVQGIIDGATFVDAPPPWTALAQEIGRVVLRYLQGGVPEAI